MIMGSEDTGIGASVTHMYEVRLVYNSIIVDIKSVN